MAHKRNIQGCRHRGTWLSTYREWCYECGAFRQLEPTGPSSAKVVSPWCYPVGIGGANPYEDFDRRAKAYRLRKT